MYIKNEERFIDSGINIVVYSLIELFHQFHEDHRMTLS